MSKEKIQMYKSLTSIARNALTMMVLTTVCLQPELKTQDVNVHKLKPPVVLGFQTKIVGEHKELSKYVGSLVTIRGKVVNSKIPTILNVIVSASLRERGESAFATGILIKLPMFDADEKFDGPRPLGGTIGHPQAYILYQGTTGVTAHAKLIEDQFKERDATKRRLDRDRKKGQVQPSLH